VLAIELQALVDLDLDVDITGFSSAEVEILFDQARAPSHRPGAVMSVRVCKARLWLRRAQPSGSPQLRFEAPMKTGLSKQVCGRRKQERASDSAGPKNDSVKFYSRREL
jgi:hypothetical protein